MSQAATLAAAAVARPRRRWLRRAAWAVLSLVAGVGAFWVWSYYAALAERDALIAKIAARGEPVWWWDVAKERLAKSNEGTGAELYLRGISGLGGETNPQKTRRPTQQWNDEVEPIKFQPRVHPLVEKEVELSAPSLAILEKAVALPPGRVVSALQNGEPVSIILSEVADMRRVQWACHWTSFDALAKGNARRAYHATWLAIAVTEQIAGEPFVMAQLVRLAALSSAADQLAMCLCHAGVPEAEFDALDASLAKWDDGFHFHPTLVAERAMWLTTLGQPNIGWLLTMDARRTSRLSGFNRALEGALLDLIGSKVSRPLIYRGQTQFLDAFDRLASRIDNPSADLEGIVEEADELDAVNVLGRATGGMKSSGVGWLARFCVSGAKTHRKLVLARLALRLRRYYDQHGRLPGKLDDLCDLAMPKIRLEWFKGEPIVYKPAGSGFRVESPHPIRVTTSAPPKEMKLVDEHGLTIEFKSPARQ